MRARSFALRDAFPDVLKGLISVEEAVDLSTPADRLMPARTIDGAPEPPPVHEPTASAQSNAPAPPPTAVDPRPEAPADADHVYLLETKQGVTVFKTRDKWLATWAKIVRGCKAANALDKLRTARDTNAAHIAAVATFDAAPVATLNAELDRALAPPSSPS